MSHDHHVTHLCLRRTSKSRRKVDRKRRSLREGSSHEEEALVEALSDIVSTVDSLQDDVDHLLPLLVQFGLTKDASAVQRSFEQLLEAVRANMGTIWPSSAAGEEAGAADIQVRVQDTPIPRILWLLLIQ